MTEPSAESRGNLEPPADAVETRAELLPEERAAGSDDPRAQAEVVLADSIERTEHPDPDASSQSGRRSSEETV
jgi:hypothetical protein